MARVCDNWLQTYLDWTIPRTEAPESMVLWSGLVALASALKRHVKVPKKLMGGYDIYPNLYVIFVAPPGVARKSTTVGRAEELMRSVPEINLASTSTSASKLVGELSETIDGSMVILPSELGTFMNVSHEEMYDVLTDLYDNKFVYTYSTRMHGEEVVERPSINFLAATTPQWVEQQMPIHVIGGGFASRVIWIFEDTPRIRQLYYSHLDPDDFERYREALAHDLKHIHAKVKGEFRLESKATQKFMEDWYQASADKKPEGSGLEGYITRKHIHIHKVAIGLAVSEGDKLVIRKEHLEKAITILEALEAKMSHALIHASANPLAEPTWRIWNYVKESGTTMSDRDIVREFHRDLGYDGISEVLATLTRAGLLERVSNFAGAGKNGYKTTDITL